MRELSKVAKPEILVDHEDVWTEEYLAAAGAERKKRERWRHAQIRAALRDELGGKCAYCEAFVDDVSFPHVEHIIPKALKPELAHRWRNLTSACGRCNNAKGEFYDETNGVLNPYEDHLDEHLVFLGNLIHWEPGQSRGELTVKKLQLNRLDLVRSRLERLTEIREVLERWHQGVEPLKSAIADALRLDVREGEFTRTTSVYLVHFGFPL